MQQTFLGRNELLQFLKSQPLLRYAYHSWGFHSKACLAEGQLPVVVSNFVARANTYPLISSDDGFDILKPCHIAAYSGLPDLLPATNEWCNQVTEILGLTPLILASANGHRAIVEELLCRNNVDINSQDKRGQTALFAASDNGHEVIVEFLLSRTDVSINTATTMASHHTAAGQTALFTASRNGHVGVVKLLLSRNDIDINSQDEDGQTALFAASCRGHEAVVKLLLSRADVAVNTTTTRSTTKSHFTFLSAGQTALLAASCNGHGGVVKLLLSRNDIDINSQDEDGQTALFAASCRGHEAVVKLLLSRVDVAVNTTTTRSTTTARSTTMARSTTTWFIRPSSRFVMPAGQTALLAAFRNGHGGVVKLLLSRNDIDINTPDMALDLLAVAMMRTFYFMSPIWKFWY